MDVKERKFFYLALVISVLLHLVALLFLKYDILFGSSHIEKQEELQPLELIFEQPKPPVEEKIPEKFYELVENPNASRETPENANMLSTESSLSRAPVITEQQLHAVPGKPLKKSTQADASPAPEEPNPLPEAVRSALLAYKATHSFNRSALTGEEKPIKERESSQEKGENPRKPEGFRAEEVGDFALSTYSWDWAPYWLAFKRKLMRIWYAPPAYYQLGLISGYTIVRFKVTREGEMYDFQVLRHVGHSSLEQSSVSAIQSMFPFLPLPDSFPDEYLEVTIRMVYPDLRAYRQ